MRRILFVCWGNCVRSQLAEVLLRFRGAGRFEAWSAGARPAGFVHALTLGVLQEMGLRPRGLRSKHWSELRSLRFDAVVVLCPFAREELEAQWPARADGDALPIQAYWEVGDPIGEHGLGRALTHEEEREAFRRARDEIREDIERLVIAPAESVDDDSAFADLLREIGG